MVPWRHWEAEKKSVILEGLPTSLHTIIGLLGVGVLVDGSGFSVGRSPVEGRGLGFRVLAPRAPKEVMMLRHA